jgi:exosome complex component RRP43
MTVTLPKATYNEETGRTTCTRKIREPLLLKCLPISYSFGVFDGYDATLALFLSKADVVGLSNRTTVLADPDAFEEPLLDTSISIVLDERGALLFTNQLGIADKDTMSVCIASAKERHEARGCEIYSF